jgi:uroporphyrinogen-III decarboxylase
MTAMNLNQFVLRSPRRRALLMAIYPGLALTDAQVSGMVAQPQVQPLAATSAHRNFVISSGCDLPSNAPLAGVDACYEAVEGVNKQFP